MATLKDVAARCSVDISTVSRALRGDERVKPETRERVRAAAEALHYSPNLAARNLVRGESRTIALIVSSLTDPMERLPAQYASTWLQERNYDLMISLTGGKEDIFERQVARLEQNLFDGALVIPGAPFSDRAEKILNRLAKRKFPLICLDRWDGMPSFPVVTSDNRNAGGELARKLMERGCPVILILSRLQNGVERERVEGALAACRERGIEPLVLSPADNLGASLPKGVEKGNLGIIGTHYGHILSFLKDHEWDGGERRIICGAFDEWPGSVYPASEVVLCEQDFESMAERACSLLLQSGSRESGRLTVPVKDFRVLGKADR